MQVLQKPKDLGTIHGDGHREGGFSFRVHSRDHEPPHVHVSIGGASVKIALPDGGEPACVLRVAGKMKARDVVTAVAILEAKSDLMWKGWLRFHGRSEEADAR